MSEPFIDFDAIFNLALKETEDGMKLGFYISEPCLVTPLESYVNKYPKIAERCNNALLELIDKQAVTTDELVGVYFENSLDSF